jgi:hypothetical protein
MKISASRSISIHVPPTVSSAIGRNGFWFIRSRMLSAVIPIPRVRYTVLEPQCKRWHNQFKRILRTKSRIKGRESSEPAEHGSHRWKPAPPPRHPYLFEALPETTETWIRIAMIQLMTKRLAAKTCLFRQALIGYASFRRKMKINTLWFLLLGFTCFALCGSSLAQEPQGISLPENSRSPQLFAAGMGKHSR